MILLTYVTFNYVEIYIHIFIKSLKKINWIKHDIFLVNLAFFLQKTQTLINIE